MSLSKIKKSISIEKAETYRAENVEAMRVKRSQITERIDLEKAKGRKISDSEVKNLIIKEKREGIKKKTGLGLNYENIITLSKEGYDLVKLKPSGNIFPRALSLKFKIESKEVSIKELRSV